MVRQLESFLVSQRSSFLVRYQLSENSYSSQLSERNIIISTLYIGSPSSSTSVLPFIARLGSSSSVVRRQPSSRQPSSLVNRRFQSVVRSSTVLFSRHSTVPHRRSTTTSPEVRTPTRPKKFLFSRAASCATCCRLLVGRRQLHPPLHWVRIIIKISF